MPEWHKIGPADMLAEGAMQEVELERATLLIARVNGRYYATQGRCPHLRGHLARGTLRGDVVTCPLHGSQFNVTTGQNRAWVEGLPGLVKGISQALVKAKNLAVYPAKVEDGQVWVQL
jgi:nitrite reductase/ring-hydroxylating ferredoxin subunit